MLTHKVRLLPVEAYEHSQDHAPIRSRLSSRPFNTAVRAGVSADYEKDQV